jgi:hypothetical protein
LATSQEEPRHDRTLVVAATGFASDWIGRLLELDRRRAWAAHHSVRNDEQPTRRLTPDFAMNPRANAWIGWALELALRLAWDIRRSATYEVAML